MSGQILGELFDRNYDDLMNSKCEIAVARYANFRCDGAFSEYETNTQKKINLQAV
jgi:hypothetical protein